MSETYRRGRGYVLDGKSVMSVTAILKEGWAKPALTKWAAGRCAAYARDNWHELASQLADGTLTLDHVHDLIAGAPWKALQEAAARGTAVHALARKLTNDEEVDFDDAIIGQVQACVRFLNEWQPRNERTEVSVFSRRFKYAGTFDLLCDIPSLGTALLDYKTNLKGPYGETGLQLAGYGNADFMLIDQVEVPMPKIDFYGSIWLQSDGHYDLYPYAVTDDIFTLFRYLHWCVAKRPFIERGIKGRAIPPPAAATEVTA